MIITFMFLEWFCLGRNQDALPGRMAKTLPALIARFMVPTWGPSGADRTEVGLILVPWTLLSGWLSGGTDHTSHICSQKPENKGIYFLSTINFHHSLWDWPSWQLQLRLNDFQSHFLSVGVAHISFIIWFHANDLTNVSTTHIPLSWKPP